MQSSHFQAPLIHCSSPCCRYCLIPAPYHSGLRPRCIVGRLYNVDGSAFGKPGPAGIGAVVRNSSDSIIFLLTKSIGVADSNSAELIVIVEVLDCIVSHILADISLVICESDSRNVVSWLTSPLQRPWNLFNIFNRLSFILPQFRNIQFKHIFHEANEMADKLAKQGVSP